jgi:hypothetical protein
MPSQQKRVRRASVSDALSERTRSLMTHSPIAHLNIGLSRPIGQNQEPRLDNSSLLPQKSISPEPQVVGATIAPANPSLSEQGYNHRAEATETGSVQPRFQTQINEAGNTIESSNDMTDQTSTKPDREHKERHYLWGACGVMIGTSIGALPSVWRFMATNALSYEGFVQVILFSSSLTLGLFLWMTLSRR